MLNSEQRAAVNLMDAGENVFLYGDAGTGKTVVINSFVEKHPGRVICLAPTGLAAQNLKHGGMTIHRFINKLDCSREEMSRLPEKTKAIVIDEISMVRSDLLSDLDQGLRNVGDRRRPFGGIPVVAVGDFYQLPPVVESLDVEQYLQRKFGGVFAFETAAWKEADFNGLRLQTMHRQTAPEFLALLRAVRDCSPDLRRQFQEIDFRLCRQPSPQARRLCCSRAIAANVNQTMVKKLSTPGKAFYGSCSGIFPKRDWPTENELIVKYDMFVLILANDPEGKYANGDTGLIAGIDDSGVCVQLQRGGQVWLKRHEWQNYDYKLNEENGECRLVQTVIGSYWQLPIAPAYAMTIHKSQGQTLEQLHLTLGHRPCFAHGQLYTALSRARSLDGITSSRSLELADVIVDERVSKFYERIS